jgi:prevent-host-death family protein
MRAVTLMIANREFSKLIMEVEHGAACLITRRGRPIAKLVPPAADKANDPDWTAAYRRRTP